MPRKKKRELTTEEIIDGHVFVRDASGKTIRVVKLAPLKVKKMKPTDQITMFESRPAQ